MAFEKIKRQFMIDSVVIFLLITGIILFVGISGMKSDGWGINGKEYVLLDQDKVVKSNVRIYGSGRLRMEDSDLTIESEYRDQYGVLISGDSRLQLLESSITCSENPCFFVAGSDEEGKNPRIELINSTITNHTGLVIGNRTRIDSEHSLLGELYIRDNAKAELLSTSVHPVLYSEERELYEGLNAGVSVSKEILAGMGWELYMKNCDVEAYTLELFDNSDITVQDSNSVSLSLHSPGNLKTSENLDLSLIGEKNSGSIVTSWFSITWKDSVIKDTSLYISGTDCISITEGILGDVDVSGDGLLSIFDSVAQWDKSFVSGRGVLNVTDVNFEVHDDYPILKVSGDARVTFQNSDITSMHIILMDHAIIEIQDTVYNPTNIENYGVGDVIIDGTPLLPVE